MGNCQHGYKDLCDGNLQRGRNGLTQDAAHASGKAQPRSSCGSTGGKGLGADSGPHGALCESRPRRSDVTWEIAVAKEGKEWGIPAKRTSEFLQKLDDTENNVAVRKSPGHLKGKREEGDYGW